MWPQHGLHSHLSQVCQSQWTASSPPASPASSSPRVRQHPKLTPSGTSRSGTAVSVSLLLVSTSPLPSVAKMWNSLDLTTNNINLYLNSTANNFPTVLIWNLTSLSLNIPNNLINMGIWIWFNTDCTGRKQGGHPEDRVWSVWGFPLRGPPRPDRHREGHNGRPGCH